MPTTEFESKPLPTVAEAYLRITGIDPRSSTTKPAAHTVAVPCVSKANHRHGDANPSLHINTEKDLWICRVCPESGGKSTALVVHAGLANDLSAASKWLCPPDPPKAPPPPIEQRRVAATYQYEAPEGNVLYEVIRYEWDTPSGVDKTFSQRALLPDGRYTNKLDGVPRVPYKYPGMIYAMSLGKTIFVVEGEKDADALRAIGLDATTNAGGAGWGWSPEFVMCFHGAPSVVVIGDNDDAGRASAKRRAELLLDVCGTVRLVDALPGVPHKGDSTDWIVAYRKANPDASDAQVAMKFKTALNRVAVILTARVDDGTARAWDITPLHLNILANQKPPTVGLMTGFRGIDEELFGLQSGETTVIASRTNVGKTLAIEHIIEENWNAHKILLFALEMGAGKMHDRLVARAQNFTVKDYRLRGRPDVAVDLEWYKSKQLRIVGKNRECTAERIVEIIEMYHPELVIIDHLRHINGWFDLTGKKRSDVGPAEIVDKLMQAAARLGHHNILCSQITRDAVGDKRPELSHLRDSGAVEEMADNVIVLHRPFKSVDGARTDMTRDDVMEIILRKAREGGEVWTHMRFVGELMALEAPKPEDFEHLTRCCR